MQSHSVWQDLLGYTFQQRWIDAGGIQTRVLEAGSPTLPPLIFLHGTGGHAEAFTRNLGPHAEHFHVYALDMVGHGYTDKPPLEYELQDYAAHIRAFMDAEGHETASISGESLGGDVAAWMAYHDRDLLEKIVLNTGAAFPVPLEVAQRIEKLSLAAVEAPTWDVVRKRLEFLFADNDTVTDDLIATRLSIYSQPEMLETMTRILSRLTDPEKRERNVITEKQWQEVTDLDVLVVWTSDDPTAPPAKGQAVADMIPGAQFEILDRCGHWPQFEDPTTFNDMHIQFLLGG